VLLAGLAQVHVHVDQAGRDQQARHVDDLRRAGRQIGADRLDHAALDEDVTRPVDCR
jgi:hypothetical protein